MGSQGLDGLLVTHLPNVRYLTNFAGSSAQIVVTAEAVHIVTDFRYKQYVEQLLASHAACPGAVLVPFQKTYDETLAALLGSLGLERMGFESAWLPVNRLLWLVRTLGIDPPGLGSLEAREAGKCRVVATERMVESLRARKDGYEIEVFRRAGALVSSLTAQVIDQVREGRTEREVAARIDLVLREGGFERTSFETIVASGPNAALPHARPGDRRIERGDLIVLDFGGVLDGYCVDLTRSVSIGDAGEEARRVHRAVAEAQSAAISAVKPGVPTDAPDRAARAVLAEWGLAELFGHGTGHGLGLEVHEEPRIGPAREPQAGRTEPQAVLEPGMVITLEPGVYRPNWGGIRIEDDVVVTEDGCEMLTSYERGLVAR